MLRATYGDIPITSDQAADVADGASVPERPNGLLHRQPGVLAPCRAGPAFGDERVPVGGTPATTAERSAGRTLVPRRRE
jgi:hypothetical protein